MLLAILALQLVLLLLAAVLLLRNSGAAAVPQDTRLAALPDAVMSLTAKLDVVDAALRNNVSELRYEQGKAATDARAAADRAARELREEIHASIAALGKPLQDGLAGLRNDNAGSSEQLKTAVHRELISLGERLTTFFADSGKAALDAQGVLHRSLTALHERNTAGHGELREALHQRLTDLGKAQHEHQNQMRESVEGQLTRLNADNVRKLEEMRVTVDEKLQTTLNERLTTSFGQVTTHLGEVQKGLGEMKELATGVSDLKRVFSNVKSRGIVGEFQLGLQLEQMFSREQYEVNVAVKPNSGERVEYALKIPDGERGHIWLPIDAKFPRESWERLEHAHEHGSREEQDRAGSEFESAIRAEGKRICAKYIDPPGTLPYAIMFLPTEALYAEVMRRPGLHTELQSACSVTIAGPSTFMAILTSLQLGFRTLAIQQKGNEVWRVLSSIKKEFEKFETLMNKVEGNVGTVQKTLGEIGVRTRAINRNLRNVSELPSPHDEEANVLMFEDIAGVAPRLAASDNEAPRSIS